MSSCMEFRMKGPVPNSDSLNPNGSINDQLVRNKVIMVEFAEPLHKEMCWSMRMLTEYFHQSQCWYVDSVK